MSIMNFHHCFSLNILLQFLLSLLIACTADPLDSCTLQQPCFDITVTLVPPGQKHWCGPCEFEVCFITDLKSADCAKRSGTISFGCIWDPYTCMDETYNWNKRENIGNKVRNCLRAEGGQTVTFLYKDGSDCTDAVPPYELMGALVWCSPRVATDPTCSSEQVDKECQWSVALDYCLPSPSPSPSRSPSPSPSPSTSPSPSPSTSPSPSPSESPSPSPSPSTSPSPSPSTSPSPSPSESPSPSPSPSTSPSPSPSTSPSPSPSTSPSPSSSPSASPSQSPSSSPSPSQSPSSSPSQSPSPSPSQSPSASPSQSPSPSPSPSPSSSPSPPPSPKCCEEPSCVGRTFSIPDPSESDLLAVLVDSHNKRLDDLEPDKEYLLYPAAKCPLNGLGLSHYTVDPPDSCDKTEIYCRADRFKVPIIIIGEDTVETPFMLKCGTVCYTYGNFNVCPPEK